MTATTKIRAGLVGAGEWARVGHVPALKCLPEYELVAVATTRLATAREAAARFGIPHACENAAQLIARADIELVIVNNRAPDHFAVAQAAIAAGKHVYCEWPLTTNLAESAALLDAAEKAGVRHVVGLQRRMGASSRCLHELVAGGYVGRVRSVHLHVTEPAFSARRPRALGFTIPGENFSSVFSIYGGHFLDLLVATLGEPAHVAGFVVSQFNEVVIAESGEAVPSTAPDQMVISGALADGAVLSAHVEGGKRNGYGVRLDVTGTGGDLRLTYDEAFSSLHDGRLAGSQDDQQPLVEMTIPDRFQWVPHSNLRGSVLELANLYAAFAHDLHQRTSHAPTFVDALRTHRLLAAIEDASRSGRRVTLAE